MKKYERVEKELQEMFRKGLYVPGTKLPSEHELCTQFSVSRNVVRQALRNLEAEGLTETVRGVGTFCRTDGRTMGLTHTIGLISFFSHSYIFPEIINGADGILFPRGFHLLVGQSNYDLHRERELIERFVKRGVDGIIIEPIDDMSRNGSNRDLLESLHARGIPIVCIDNKIDGIDTVSITLNDQQAGYRAAEYFYERGHRSAAIFYQQDYRTKVERKDGAVAFLSSAPGAAPPVLVPFSGQGENSSAGAAAAEFLDTRAPGCTAVFCSSDEDARHIIVAAEKRGICIPEDLSIIGFDNRLDSELQRVRLTTFQHPSRKFGRLAAMTLIDQILYPGDSAPTSIMLDATLIERDSVIDLRA